MFQILVPDAEINPGDITNHPDNTKRYILEISFVHLYTNM